jgi:hypothetical protein
MSTLQVFDRPMCCSTGVCGPSVDPALPRFASDLEWLRGRGVTVERYNLAQQPAAFAAHEDVRQALAERGTSCLPLIRVDGRIVSRGVYPTRELLAGWVPLRPSEGAGESISLPVSEGCACKPGQCC